MMISYIPKDDHIAVKWNKTEIGRILKEKRQFFYSPRGCQGLIKSEPFSSLTAVKKFIEGKENA